jgi:hypothetical protein
VPEVTPAALSMSQPQSGRTNFLAIAAGADSSPAAVALVALVALAMSAAELSSASARCRHAAAGIWLAPAHPPASRRRTLARPASTPATWCVGEAARRSSRVSIARIARKFIGFHKKCTLLIYSCTRYSAILYL